MMWTEASLRSFRDVPKGTLKTMGLGNWKEGERAVVTILSSNLLLGKSQLSSS